MGLPGPSPVGDGWWPKGGAVWDAGARVHGPDGQIGGVLVEAKGRESELTSGGCKATSETSIKTIRSALADVQNALGVAPSHEWMGACYQPANRLAFLWYSRVKRDPPVPVWFVSLVLHRRALRDRRGRAGSAHPAREAWEPIIEALHKRMGLPPRAALSSPHRWIEAFLPALEPSGGVASWTPRG